MPRRRLGWTPPHPNPRQLFDVACVAHCNGSAIEETIMTFLSAHESEKF